MNKARFIERLNLHLDGELSAEESEELFRAMRRSEDFQRIYRQYCQIYSACAQLGGDFANERKASPVLQRVYAIGGLAAAFALLALAAQNLAPVIGLERPLALDFQPVELAVAAPASTNDAPAERLLIVDADTLRKDTLALHELELANFDVDAAFEADRDVQSAPVGVTFATYGAEKQSLAPEARWKRPFLLEQPRRAATFQHEAITAQDAAKATLGERQVSSSHAVGLTDADGEIRFDLKRAEAFPVSLPAAKMGAAGSGNR